MGYDFHKLKTIRCFDAVTIRVPERWDCGPDHKLEDHWSCYKDGEESGTLWILVERFLLSEDAPNDPEFDHRTITLGIIEEQRKEFGPFLRDEFSEIEDGFLLYREFEGENGGENLRYFRYNYHLCRENEIAYVDFNFVLPVSVIDDPEIRELIEIVDREVRSATIDPFSDHTDESVANIEQTLEHHRLRVAEPWPGSTVRVPADWDSRRNSDSEWWAGDPRSSISFYFKRDQLAPPEDISPDDNLVRISAERCERTIVGFLEDIGTVGPISFEHSLNGRIVHAVVDHEEGDRHIRTFRSYVITGMTDGAALQTLTLSVIRERAENPPVRELVDLYRDEARALKIGSDWNAEEGFAWLKQMNFDGRVVLNVPVFMQAKPDEDDLDSWYCYFQTDSVDASMWVLIQEIGFFDEEDGEPISVREGIYEEVLENVLDQFLDEPPPERVMSRVPGGVLSFETYDDTEPMETADLEDTNTEEFRPLRNLLWNRAYFGDGYARIARFLLMLPFDRADEEPLPELVRVMEREIRRADFPERPMAE